MLFLYTSDGPNLCSLRSMSSTPVPPFGLNLVWCLHLFILCLLLTSAIVPNHSISIASPAPYLVMIE